MAEKGENSPGGDVEKPFQKADADDYGYYFYPSRNEDQSKKPSSMLAKIFGRNDGRRHMKCEMNVAWCVKNNPFVKLLMGAMKSKGCPIVLNRHISCENCKGRVNGGYDPETNQVVVCQNTATQSSTCCSVLAHEFIHAFDNCRAKVDFDNLEHLACTEIRAANLVHCSFSTALFEGDASPIRIKETQQECVKRKAILSIIMVRNITAAKAREVVDKVFERCYNDMEPIGRRCRRKSKDPEMAYHEGYLYGYTD